MKITNEKEYEESLKIIDQLWHLKPEEEGFDELEMHIDAILKYEDETYQDYLFNSDPISMMLSRFWFRVEQGGLINIKKV